MPEYKRTDAPIAKRPLEATAEPEGSLAPTSTELEPVGTGALAGKAAEVKDGIVDKAKHVASAARDRATALGGAVSGKSRATKSGIEAQVRERPMRSLLVAAGVGYALGKLMDVRSSASSSSAATRESTLRRLTGSGTNGGKGSGRTARELMTAAPRFVTPESTVQEAARLMRDEDVGLIPVVDSTSTRILVGVVTDRDLAMRLVAEDREVKHAVVRDVMSRDLRTVPADESADRVMRIMGDAQVRRVPVVGADGVLLGIIAQADVVRHEDDKSAATTIERISR